MITTEYAKFFKNLEQNNNREWFHEQKKTYETFVKEPFLKLLESLIPQLKLLEPRISQNPKDALFRINRDIRFSKDKTPYNTLMKASFSPGGKKSIFPGYYLGISGDCIHLGGGLYNLKTQELKKVRRLIKNNHKEFLNIVESEKFKNIFETIKGEQSKRLDKEFLGILNEIPFIAYKQFYVMHKIDISPFLNSDKLESVIVEHFELISHLNKFLNNAFSD